MPQRHVTIGSLTLGNDLPLVFIVGPNTLESRAHALEMSAALAEMAGKLGIGLVYKTSFDKANRSSLGSERGIGLRAGLPILAEVRETTGIPVLTDIHEREQCGPDATHSVAQPGGLGDRSGGQREFAPVLARAAAAVGVAAIFIETHRDPDHTTSAEGPTMMPLKALPSLLETLVAFDRLAKARPLIAE